MSDIKIGTLEDCPCAEGAGGDLADVQVYNYDAPPALPTAPQLAPPMDQMRFRPRRPPKPRKPRSKGKGPYCVISHKGKVVHCYESKDTANRVATAFTERGRAGTKFSVKKR